MTAKRKSSTGKFKAIPSDFLEEFDIDVSPEDALNELGMAVSTLTHHVKELRTEHNEQKNDFKSFIIELQLIKQEVNRVSNLISDIKSNGINDLKTNIALMDRKISEEHTNMGRAITEEHTHCPVRRLVEDTGKLPSEKSDQKSVEASNGSSNGVVGKIFNPQMFPLILIGMLLIIIMALIGITQLGYDKKTGTIYIKKTEGEIKKADPKLIDSIKDNIVKESL